MLPPSLVLLSSLLVALAHAGSPVDVTFPAESSAIARGNVIEDNFIGISWELSSFNTLWGKSVDQQPNAMQNYLHNIAVRLSKPLRIRVGGNGMDGSTYVPSQKSVLEFSDPNAYFNDIPVNFGPALFDIMNGMYDKVGAMEFMIGLSMRNPDAWDNVVELAVAAEEKLGDKLDAMLLGNEPDLYAGHGERDAYTIDDYVRFSLLSFSIGADSGQIPEVGEVLDELSETGALNQSIMAGPTVCCQWDLDDIFEAGFDQYDYKYYTIQRYPNNACQGETPENTNLTYYLTHANVGKYLGWQKKGMDVARQRNVPVIMTEYNSVACGGSNISSTFGAALWAIDVGLKAASMNYSAVFLHTREYGVQYNLFDPPTPEASTSAGWRTGSPYYSALFLAEITDTSGSVVVDLNLGNSTTDQFAKIAGYGIYEDGGSTRGRLVFFNYANPDSDGDDATQQFRVPANVTDQVDYRILAAPDVTERTNIKWAGQTVGPNGDLEGDQETITVNCKNGCLIDVPGPGVVLVMLGSEREGRLFTGNSTIAPYQYLSNDALVDFGPSRTTLVVAASLVILMLFS
ncbi:hypothetical protein AN958_03168 [Leucoagaricus sp. SymC.cos]|nr:hypothetical protein AN958_03168 [Leucoagaricus sp. SymC.cos]